MPLKYHAAVFDRIGHEPVISPSRVAALKAREAELGQHFPASVFEFFSIEGIDELFYKNSEQHLTEIDKIGRCGGANEMRHGWLMVGTENQAVVNFWVKLGEGDPDNPAAYDDRDSFEYEEDAGVETYAKTEWMALDYPFDMFVFSFMSTESWSEYQVEGKATAPSPTDLARLSKYMRAGPHFKRAERELWQFYLPGGTMTISSRPNRDPAAAWSIVAGSTVAFEQMLRLAVPVVGMAGMIEPKPVTHKLTPQASEARAIRARVIADSR